MGEMINLRSRRVTRFLHPSVLWSVFAIFVAASTGTFAASWRLESDGSRNLDSSFYNLLSQSFLTLIASWCTVHPVLHDHLSKRRSRVELPAPKVVFIFSFLTTAFAAVAAPVAYSRLRDRALAENIGNTMNFVSTFFTVVTASQLAGGVMRITD
ncbi:hypothetical protein F5883DRAFT_646091 [Diaporthe sp. PMI_573]|nr:hypothetical protein F5883DRAFT_646091 [Diaporthaceae sp. PMI_573]